MQPDDNVERMEESRKLYEQAREALLTGDRRMAIEKFKESYRAAPHFKTFELLGEAFMAEGEYIDAIVYLSAAAGLGEKQFRSRFLLAKAMLALGDAWKDEAVEQLKESLKLNRNYRAAEQLLKELNRKGRVQKKKEIKRGTSK